jgi:hypothetical protein
MSKYPQNGFPRLVVVGSSKKKPRKVASRLRLSGPAQTSPLPEEAVRMAVMPTLSRNLWLAGLGWVWNFARSYFVNPRRRSAVVLSFPGKKESGSVGWNRDCGVAPQEGGRA